MVQTVSDGRVCDNLHSYANGFETDSVHCRDHIGDTSVCLLEYVLLQICSNSELCPIRLDVTPDKESIEDGHDKEKLGCKRGAFA